jgi:hypothetical protein
VTEGSCKKPTKDFFCIHIQEAARRQQVASIRVLEAAQSFQERALSRSIDRSISHETAARMHLKKSSASVSAMESSVEKTLCMLRRAKHPRLLLLLRRHFSNEPLAKNLLSMTHA